MWELTKFVVSDVDGTLIYKDSHLNTARLPVMLKMLEEQSVPFAVATGRHYRELKKIFGQYEKEILCICCEGAYAVKNGATIYADAIERTSVKHFFDTFKNLPVAVEFHSINCSYILGASPLLLLKENSRLGNVIKISSADEIKKDVFMISVYGDFKNHTLPVDVRLCYSSYGISEYTSKTASKYRAVKSICELSGNALSETLFFGDGSNDAQLIRSCGISYTTYCADKSVFSLTDNHTRDVIGTIIRLAGAWQR
ncbi:MAG: HAD family phosphatase [Ruminococcaceae bacterium]|nr:HAD family phosphatase [Oscillospiraceae bacterium]